MKRVPLIPIIAIIVIVGLFIVLELGEAPDNILVSPDSSVESQKGGPSSPATARAC